MRPLLWRIGLLVALLVAVGTVWALGDRGRWRRRLPDRFLLGIPWGTLVVVAVLVAFYLFAQGGLRHPRDPVVYPFVTWSYAYPTGLLTAGIAHGSLAHLTANVVGTLALAPIAEYAWGHRAGGHRDSTGSRSSTWRALVRAIVLFPAALLAAATVTAVLGLGPGLGFSGAVFAVAGVAVVSHPVATLLGVVAASALRTVYLAVTEPVVRAGIEAAPPAPPSWASIGFQAHALGFLIGVTVGAVLLRRRGRGASVDRVFAATFLLGMVQALWLVVWVEDGTFVLYRALGVAVVALVAVPVAVAAGGSDRPLPRPLARLPGRPTRRQLAGGWLTVLAVATALGVVGVLVEGSAVAVGVGTLLVVAGLLALPALPAILPASVLGGPVTRRTAATGVVAFLAVLAAVPSVPVGLVVVDAAGIADAETVAVGDYTLGYAENATVARRSLVEVDDETVPVANGTTPPTASGVILVSDAREIWTVAVRADRLAYTGEATVVVGGLGWRETVSVNRTGWDVVGNDTVYAVDLSVDGVTTQSFRSDPARASPRLDGRAVTVRPTTDGFEFAVSTDGELVGTAPIPPVNGTVTVGDVDLRTVVSDGRTRVTAAIDDSEAVVAVRERYRGS